MRSRLEPDGFSIDAKPMTEKTDLPYSLHASKSMRLIVPDMQALSARLDALATEFGGLASARAVGADGRLRLKPHVIRSRSI